MIGAELRTLLMSKDVCQSWRCHVLSEGSSGKGSDKNEKEVVEKEEESDDDILFDIPLEDEELLER